MHQVSANRNAIRRRLKIISGKKRTFRKSEYARSENKTNEIRWENVRTDPNAKSYTSPNFFFKVKSPIYSPSGKFENGTVDGHRLLFTIQLQYENP